ncbi:MAG: carboxypeptidase regulatory-like domain-containing protein [Candidatus Poribacteria bacterium]
MIKYFLFILLIFNTIIFISCGGDSEEKQIIIEQGDIFGIVTDKETGQPIKGATVQIANKTAQTDDNGRYMINSIPISDKIEITVKASDYQEYKDIFSFKQELLSYNISLIPLKSPTVPINFILDSIGADITSLDAKKIPDIQANFSKSYVASNSDATIFGVIAGVVPANYDAIPKSIETIIDKYTKIEFKFVNRDIKIDGDNASVLMRIKIKAQTKPPDAADYDIEASGKIDFKKENDNWKITFWELIEFFKFEQNPI